MKIKTFYTIFLFLLFNSDGAFSQSVFQKTILNSISVRGLQQLDNNRIAIITNDPNGWDSLLLSILDSMGNVILQRTLNVGGFSYESIKMEKTLDGGLIILCHNYSCLIKIDSVFNIEWMKFYRKHSKTVAGGALKQLPDSGYIICGYVIDTLPDKLIFKTDKTGSVEWSKIYNSTSYENLACIQVTLDGGYIFAGDNGGTTSMCGISITKADSTGNILWSKVLANCGDNVKALSLTSDGGYILCGGNDVGVPIAKAAKIIKLDSLGSLQWTKTISAIGNTYLSGRSVEQISDSSYFLGGIRNLTNSGNDFDIFLMKFDINGDTIWSKVYGDIGKEKASHFIQSYDNGFIIGGEASNNSFGLSGFNSYLLKTDSLGMSGCFELQSNFEIAIDSIFVRVDSVIGINGGITIDSLSATSSSGIAPIIDLCTLTSFGNGQENHPEFIVFPNPANDVIYINLNSTTKKITIEITDSRGAVVYRENINESQWENDIIKIELSQILKYSGTFQITILSGSEKIGFKKFVLIK
ncbi:MAG TPA: T9SS type A sorting domain-containing protein [Bacteroidia bacterium]|nr:T9SS type A sorting domain-containing protein [Bacteroidia bacterium]